MDRPIVVWWVKRDARLADNAVLGEAARLGAFVLPFFCFEPSVLDATDSSTLHLHAQWQAIRHLRDQLRQRGADVLIAHGEVIEKLRKLRDHICPTHVFAHEEIGNAITYGRDLAVADWCREQGIVYREFPQSSVRRGGVNRDRLQAVWRERIVQVEPLAISAVEQNSEMTRLASRSACPEFEFPANAASWQSVTEYDAGANLRDFLNDRGVRYRGGISSPNTALTSGSRLSVHLAWGTLTARQIWHATQRRLRDLDRSDPASRRWRLSLQSFSSRLHWRDHFIQRLESEPELEFRSIHPAYRDIPYRNDEYYLAAWREGRTGYPLVDAVMRCLSATGFVNFRMRAMVVSFACHVLHLDWRLIHPHLAGVFRDYEPGIHLSQLQMQAGVVGWNAIRVYNPTKQLHDWDRQCRFVKQWVPELRNYSAEQILHCDQEVLTRYPPPIAAFAPQSKIMKDLLYAIRKSEAAKAATAAVYAKHGSRRKEIRFTKRQRQPIEREGELRQRSLFD